MCFSAEADLLAGVVVGGVGVDALRHSTRRADVALASIPIVLATHSFIEAFVWWGLQGDVPTEVGRVATYLYLAIAFVVLPALVPFAIRAIEPEANARRLVVFGFVGVAVAAALAWALARGPVTATIMRHHIAYSVGLRNGGLVVAAYVLAVCGPMLLSVHTHVRRFGVANLLAVAVLAWIAQSGFISLWCVWAAVTSVAIAVHLRAVSGSTFRATAHD